MKSVKILAVLVAGLALLYASAAAQDESTSGGVYGFSSIEFDESTNTVFGYCETDLDYDVQGEYDAYVRCSLSDDSGALLGSGIDTDTGSINGFASVDLEVTGTPNTEYTVRGFHKALADFSDYDYDEFGRIYYFYWDDYFFGYFEPFAIYSPWDFNLYGPGPSQTRRPRAINLGSTYDQDTLKTPPACGDERDTIIKEYSTYRVSLRPQCGDFTQNAQSDYYGFSDFNRSCPSRGGQPGYSWALVRNPLVVPSWSGYGLSTWIYLIGSTKTINSSYRSPSINRACGSTAPNSKHQFGVAIDLRNDSRTWNEWNYIGTLAFNGSGSAPDARADYVEPFAGPCGAGCIHADWRNHDVGIYAH